MSAKISVDREKIAEFCRRHHIGRLSLFGSVLRDDFRPESDVDVLVEFEPGHVPGLDFFTMAEDLTTIFGRKVDLVEKTGLRNPFRRYAILKTRQIIYAA